MDIRSERRAHRANSGLRISRRLNCDAVPAEYHAVFGALVHVWPRKSDRPSIIPDDAHDNPRIPFKGAESQDLIMVDARLLDRLYFISLRVHTHVVRTWLG